MTAPEMPPQQTAAQAAEQKRIEDVVTALIPLTDDGTPTPLGQRVFEAIVRAIGEERVRAVQIVREIATQAHKAAQQAEGHAQAAQVSGNQGAFQQAVAVMAHANAVAMALMGASNVIMLTPGECRSCGGSKLSRSKLNARHLVPCEACKPTSEEATPS